MAETLTLSRDWLDMLDGLPDDSARWTVLKAVAGYALDGTEPDGLTDAENGIFRIMKNTIRERERKLRYITKRRRQPSTVASTVDPPQPSTVASTVDAPQPSTVDGQPVEEKEKNQKKKETPPYELPETIERVKGGAGESKTDPPKAEKRKIFIPPKVEDVAAYCRERNNTIDPQQFVDFYTMKGWRVGKETMKDWKAAVRTWERRHYNQQQDRRPKRDYSGI